MTKVGCCSAASSEVIPIIAQHKDMGFAFVAKFIFCYCATIKDLPEVATQHQPSISSYDGASQDAAAIPARPSLPARVYVFVWLAF